MLYALVERRELDKAELATELWGTYRAGTHDNALWMNMTRLRRLLAPMGLTVQSSDRGYRVVLPPEFVFVRVHG